MASCLGTSIIKMSGFLNECNVVSVVLSVVPDALVQWVRWPLTLTPVFGIGTFAGSVSCRYICDKAREECNCTWL